jgi:hypothetical protein
MERSTTDVVGGALLAENAGAALDEIEQVSHQIASLVQNISSSYESPTEAKYRNKVHMFNEGGEVVLFDKLGFNAVFYGEVLSGSRMPNLMYMTTFKNMVVRDSLWEAFFESDKWKSLEKNPEYQHNVSHADIYLLYPTPYSEY